MLNSKFS